MALFEAEIPNDILKDFERINKDYEKIFGGMTKAGAETAMANVKNNAPHPDIASHTKLSKVYKTPSDDGINTKVYFSGYLPFKGNRTTFVRRNKSGGKVYSTSKGIPVEFIAMVFEHGRSGLPFPKKPFFRRSFKKDQIEAAMLKAQKELSGGLLE